MSKQAILIATLIAGGSIAVCHAQTGNRSLGRTGVPGGRQIARHNPYSTHYVDMRPGGHLAQQYKNSYRYGGHHHGLNLLSNGYYPYGYGYGGYGYGGYGYGYGYSYTGIYGTGLSVGYGYPGYYYPSYPYPAISYPYGATGQWGPYSYVGPLVLPTGALYGVQQLNQIVPGAVPTAQLPAAASQAEPEPEPKAGEEVPAPPRVSNREARGRALRFVEFGDRHFADEQYFDAYQRYKSASLAAPDLATTYFRQGFALAALGRYERAFEVMRRGLALDPDWSKSNFHLRDLFGDNNEALKSHLEQLAKFVDQHPQHGEAMFLLAASLYFDGQQERSRPFLQRAKELLKVELAAELPATEAPDEPPPAEQPAAAPQADAEELPLEI